MRPTTRRSWPPSSHPASRGLRPVALPMHREPERVERVRLQSGCVDARGREAVLDAGLQLLGRCTVEREQQDVLRLHDVVPDRVGGPGHHHRRLAGPSSGDDLDTVVHRDDRGCLLRRQGLRLDGVEEAPPVYERAVQGPRVRRLAERPEIDAQEVDGGALGVPKPSSRDQRRRRPRRVPLRSNVAGDPAQVGLCAGQSVAHERRPSHRRVHTLCVGPVEWSAPGPHPEHGDERDRHQDDRDGRYGHRPGQDDDVS